MQAQTRFTVGCDPEFFLIDREKGQYCSAHDLVPGSKDKPHILKYGAVQVDGTAVEFNTDPAHSEDEFVHNVTEVMAQIRAMIPKRYDFHFRPFVKYAAPYFKSLPREAIELGCNPDYNAYTFDKNPSPNADQTTRTASGHIHLGWDRDTTEITREHIVFCGRLSRNLDVTLGIPSLGWDRDNVRRKLYGKAGAYRPKPYGVEYRTLSNVWITDERLMRRVYQGAIDGAEDFFEKGPGCKFMQVRADDIQRRINGANE